MMDPCRATILADGKRQHCRRPKNCFEKIPGLLSLVFSSFEEKSDGKEFKSLAFEKSEAWLLFLKERELSISRTYLHDGWLKQIERRACPETG
jgi:hypothetical protein